MDHPTHDHSPAPVTTTPTRSKPDGGRSHVSEVEVVLDVRRVEERSCLDFLPARVAARTVVFELTVYVVWWDVDEHS